MSGHDVAVDALVALAVGGELVCVVGLLAGREAIDRLHYAGAAMTVPPAFLAAALLVENGWTQPAINGLVVVLFLALFGGVLNHATGRVVRARTVGQVGARAEERL
jgi:multisubunit Na+/H+ antiporter MnhG subunit